MNWALDGVLGVLGLTPRPIATHSIGEVQELLGLVLTVSPIRRSWLDPSTRLRIRDLADQMETSLPEFSEIAVLKAALDLQDINVIMKPQGSDPDLLRTRDLHSVVTLRNELETTVASLRTLADRHREASGALQEVLSVLGLIPRDLVMKGLWRARLLFGMVVGVGPVHPAWIHPQDRQEVLEVLERCREKESLNSAARLNLIDRLEQEAFEQAAAAIVRRCLSYRPRWRRFLPGWWGLKRRVSCLYRGARLPEVVLVLADMEELDRYHQRADFLRETTKRYADTLAMRESGKADWERTIEAIQTCEQFDPLLRIVPDLREILVDPSRIEKVDFLRAHASLADEYAAFRAAIPPVAQFIDLEGLLGPAAGQ